MVQVKFAQGTSIEQTDAAIRRIEAKLPEYKDVEFFLSTVGAGTGGVLSGGATGTHQGQIHIEFVDLQDREGDSSELVDELREDMKKRNIDLAEIGRRVSTALKTGQQRMEAKLKRKEQERDREINRIETMLNLQIREVQDWYKMCAVVLPPIPPLLVAVVFFFTRRAREREGVAQTRLRS